MRLHFAIAFTLLPAAISAQSPLLPPTQQIALAVLPLPMEFRADATVMGYRAVGGKLVMLRETKGAMICLADNPTEPNFHVACYVRTIEPFMARGRELRAQGVKGEQVDTMRFADVRSGKIKMPTAPAAVWTLTGPRTAVDAKGGKVGAAVMGDHSLYVPFATAASTGLPTRASPGIPWLMYPGTPKAHIMFAMTM